MLLLLLLPFERQLCCVPTGAAVAGVFAAATATVVCLGMPTHLKRCTGKLIDVTNCFRQGIAVIPL